jgi:hypothetical protein
MTFSCRMQWTIGAMADGERAGFGLDVFRLISFLRPD